MMQRLPDWENRLSDTLADWSTRTFRWDADCARYLAAIVIAITGHDPIADLRGQYRTKREALKLLAEKPMEKRLDERFPRIPIAFAQRGDIALTHEIALGCILGSEAQCFVGNGRMGLVARPDWLGTWAVGHNG